MFVQAKKLEIAINGIIAILHQPSQQLKVSRSLFSYVYVSQSPLQRTPDCCDIK